MIVHRCSLQKSINGFDFSSKLAETRINNKISFENMSTERIFSLTGLKKDDFDDLCNIIRDSDLKFLTVNLMDALGFFLIKYRLGLSIQQTCNLFNICGYSQAKELIIQVRKILMDKLVSKNLGFENMSRDDVNNKHTTTLSKNLFDVGKDSLIVVWDGTYCYIQKSSNYSFLKQSYSIHKNRHLLKMMLVVTTKGS